MSTNAIASLLDGLMEEQLSEEEAGEIGNAYFAKRAELKGSTVTPEKTKSVLQIIALMDKRLKVIEARLGITLE